MRRTPEQRALVAERKRLTPLIGDTTDAIGAVATAAHTQLERLSTPSTTRLSHSHTLFFIPYDVIRRTVSPDLPPDSPLLPIHIATIKGERDVVENFYTNHTRRRLVTVGLKPEAIPRKVSIQSDGLVEYTRGSDLGELPIPTQPRAIETGDLDVYQKPDELREDYARAFQGAVGATIFVAFTLDRALEIKTKTNELHKLIKEWRKVAPVEMHPEIAVLLPYKP